MGNQLAPKRNLLQATKLRHDPGRRRESLRLDDSQPTLPDTFPAQHPQVVLANRGKGRPGKSAKGHSRPRVRSNRLASGTSLKRAGVTGLLQSQPVPMAATAKREDFLKRRAATTLLGKP